MIKHVQNFSITERLLITSDALQFVKILNPRTISCSGWSAALAFLTNSPLDPSVHLGVSDVQADSLEDPTYLKIHIKCAKTDPFLIGCNIYICQGSNIICPVVAMGHLCGCAWPFPRASVSFVLKLVIP